MHNLDLDKAEYTVKVLEAGNWLQAAGMMSAMISEIRRLYSRPVAHKPVAMDQGPSLLPCPFCGGIGVYIVHHGNQFGVECNGPCGISHQPMGKTMPELGSIWNGRPASRGAAALRMETAEMLAGFVNSNFHDLDDDGRRLFLEDADRAIAFFASRMATPTLAPQHEFSASEADPIWCGLCLEHRRDHPAPTARSAPEPKAEGPRS